LDTDDPSNDPGRSLAHPRPKLAAKYLQVFDVGLSSARALFAKRRMGKSEFLEQDLIPAARDAGYLTVYLNLWDARSQPAPAFLAALTQALKPTGLRKLAKTLKRPLTIAIKRILLTVFRTVLWGVTF